MSKIEDKPLQDSTEIIDRMLPQCLNETMILNKNDLQKIGELIDNKLDIRFDTQKEEIQELITEFKSDMFTKIDPILKEVVTARDERPIITEKQSNHEDRIEALEKIHPQGEHIPATS